MKFSGEVWRSLTGSQIRLCEEISFVGKGGWVYMSRQYLAGKVGVSKWQVSRISSKLVELGILDKLQRRFRRKDGTWDTRPCLYRLVGWARWKFSGIFRKLTGVRSKARRTELKEKVACIDLSFMGNEARKAYLEEFARKGKAPPEE